jgi:hypothetical protein
VYRERTGPGERRFDPKTIRTRVDPFIDSEEIPEYYANILGIRTGPYDVELVFGLTHPNKMSKALVRVRTSQKHFQAIGVTIMDVLRKQEKAS